VGEYFGIVILDDMFFVSAGCVGIRVKRWGGDLNQYLSPDWWNQRKRPYEN